MSDTWIVIIGTVVLFVLFAAVRYFRAGTKHDDVVSKAWRKEQAKKEEEAWKRGEPSIRLDTDIEVDSHAYKKAHKKADDDTKTWPLPPAAV